MFLARYFLIAVALCLLSGNAIWAQAIQFAPAFGQDEDSIKEGLMGSMKLEIDALRRVADLPENTVKKLNVAAMQAVEAAIKNSPVQKLGGRAFPMLPRNAKPPKEGTLSDEDEEDKARIDKEEPPANANVFPGAIVQIDVRSVKNQEPWKKVLASLDPEKKELIDTFEKKRAKESRAFRVAVKVQDFDDAMLLSESQKSAVTELVDRVMGDQLAMQPRNNGLLAGGGAMVVMVAGQFGKEIPKDELKKILSAVQFEEYENMLNRQAQGPFNFGGPPPGFGKNNKDDPQNSSLGFTFKEKENGLTVESVALDSRADQAGLKIGDVIDGIDDKPIDNAVQLKRAIASSTKKLMIMQVKREGTELDLEFQKKK